MQINNKRIVVTGAASGIGKALLNQLSQFDCTILAVDRNTEALNMVVSTLRSSPAEIESYVCDIADQRSLDQLFAHADVVMGGIDIFIANAGYAYYEQLLQEDWEHIDQIFQVNVHSPIYTTIKMKNTHPDSTYKMVITASAIGKLGLPGYALYAATKSAVDRFAEAFRFELDDPTQLALVYPIATRTNFFKEASDHKAPSPWPSQTADQVASAIIKGIVRDKKSIYPSFVYRIFFTIGKLIPALFRLEQWIEKQRFEKWIQEKKKSI